jgi:N-acetylmuramoyl-L-alanine amidase
MAWRGSLIKQHYNFTPMTMKKFIYTLILLPLTGMLLAQKPFIKIVSPAGNDKIVGNPKQFITGTTCTNCVLTIAGKNIKVYKTGVFVYPALLVSGKNEFTITATINKSSVSENVNYTYRAQKPVQETDSAVIEKILIEPSGDVALPEGEYLWIKVKAKPNCKLQMNNLYNLKELPKSQTNGVGGYYQLNYKIKAADRLLLSKFKFELSRNGVVLDTRTDQNVYTVFNDSDPMIGVANMVNTPVYSGLGEDRLGGTKAGFLDSAVLLQITGRVNNLYRVKLNKGLSVYIPKSNISVLPEGNTIPHSLSGSVSVRGDSAFDYVRIGLNAKLPYLTTQNTRPNQVVVDVYGATINSNWVMQYPETLEEIESVSVNQLQDDMVRITIDLKNKQLWGYYLYYEGTALVVKIRRQKKELLLKNMVIGVDAGHGGSNDGAPGIAGKYEKEFTLLIAKELRDLLEEEGATVIMTREKDISFENQERLKMFRKILPDFVVSIHLNSADDPLRVKGASTYYKLTAFKNLSSQIYKRIRETGLNGWGNIGNFNFFLNSPTEFPNALVECLFISNPEDEEKVYDPGFRTLLNQKIVAGIKDWLQLCAQNK